MPPAVNYTPMIALNAFTALLLGQLDAYQLLMHRKSYPDPGAYDPGSGTCRDDTTWSAYGNNIYTCEWLALYDPGCVRNSCHGSSDFGQCDACPRTCHQCREPSSPPGLPSEPISAAATPPASVDDPQGDAPLTTPFAYTVVSLLYLAAIVGAVAAVMEMRVHGSFTQAVSRGEASALPLMGVLVTLYLLLLLCSLARLFTAPDLCVSPYQRVVPYSRATSLQGRVISFQYSGTERIYAVLITENALDLFGTRCQPYSFGLFLSMFAILLHS